MKSYELCHCEEDPYCITRSDRPPQIIEWHEDVTIEQLHMMHEHDLNEDRKHPEYRAIFNEEPVPEDFEEYLKEMIADGFLREAS